jgi:hypothetical protein
MGTALPLHLCQVLEEEHEELWGPLRERPGWLFTPDHLHLVPLVVRLRDKGDDVAARVAEWLPDELRGRIAGLTQLGDESLGQELADAFNALLDKPELCTPGFCEGMDVPQDVQIVLADGPEVRGDDRRRMNRLILEAAFPLEIRKIYDLRLAAIHHHLPAGRSALCLSGGGVRSAVFSLGVLQGLARRGLLETFDYLSTVSGGGYMGSLLTSWIHRHRRGIEGVTAELAGRHEAAALAPEPAPVSYLRSYSNYLSPLLGLLSADTWTLAASYLRNLYLHWLIMIPFLIAVLLVPRLYLIFLRWAPDRELRSLAEMSAPHAGLLGLGALLLAGAVAWIGLLQPGERTWQSRRRFLRTCGLALGVAALAGALGWGGVWKWGGKETLSALPAWRAALFAGGALLALGTMALLGLRWSAVKKRWAPWVYRLPIAGAIAALSLSAALHWLWRDGVLSQIPGFLRPDLLVWYAGLFLAGSLLMSGAIAYIGWYRPSGGRRSSQRGFLLLCLAPLVTSAEALTIFWAWYRHDNKVDAPWLWFLLPAAAINVLGWSVHTFWLFRRRKLKRSKLWELPCAIGAGFFGGALTRWVALSPLFEDPERDLPLYICFALPALLLIFLAGETLFAGLASQWTVDEDREWWARCAGWVLIAVVAWVAVSYTVMIGPFVLVKLPQVFAPLGGLSAIATALLARSSLTMERKAKPDTKDWKAALLDGALGFVAPIFVLFLLAGLSLVVGRALHAWKPAVEERIGNQHPERAARIHWTKPVETKKEEGVVVPPFPFPLQQKEIDLLFDRIDSDNHLATTGGLLIGSLAFGLLMARLMNINQFSLHAMYRNRLIRTFLGASRNGRERRPNPFTGFDPEDDLEMHQLGVPLFLHRRELAGGGAPLCAQLLREDDPVAELLAQRLSPDTRRALASWGGEGMPGETLVAAVLADLNRLLSGKALSQKDLKVLGADDDELGKVRLLAGEERQRRVRSVLVRSLNGTVDDSHPPRPFHVVNVALNLVGGKRLAWQQRKAEPFSFTPLHCGSLRVGYRPAREYGGEESAVSLGTAVAISGAAASPNMGYHSSSAITFLMTFFNVRLGWWLGNPGTAGGTTGGTTFDRSHPRWAVRPLLEETLGLTDDANPYVYLSDGGHFENLGLYEMVLRRCHTIVAVDAGEDHDCKFEDLGNAIRKIRIDLGIPIEIEKISIYAGPEKVPAGGKGRYCAVGTIRYSCIDPEAEDGTLVYFKPTVYGIEPRDILHYREQNPLFPHESTGDQWFSEPQFESYRMLGSHAVDAVCCALKNKEIAGLDDLVECARAHTQGTAEPARPARRPSFTALKAG